MRVMDIRHDTGAEYRFEVYNEPDMAIVKDMAGRWRFEHRCYVVGGDVALVNPVMDFEDGSIGSVAIGLDKLPRASLDHSVHCEGCDMLGFVRGSLWTSPY